MNGLVALIKKELLAIWSDKKSRMIVIVPPLLQLFLFAFAITLDVKNVSIGILDRDNSSFSKELIRGLDYSKTFTNIYMLKSEKELTSLIDSQKVLATIYIPQDFSQKLSNNQNTSIQIIADGRKSNTAQITQVYIQNTLSSITSQYEVTKQPLVVRNLYNPNLDNFWWILPNLVGSLSMIVALILTSLSVARERELGTFDQILVSPLSPLTLILGKTLAPLLISIVEASFILILVINLFKVPFVGSFLILYLGLSAFLFSVVGLGLLISSISSTQQQGIMGAFVLLVPYILMSGFATPVENMPSWLVPFTDLVSLKYFLILLKGVFLKDISFSMSIQLILPMVVLGIISLVSASWLFRKKIN